MSRSLPLEQIVQCVWNFPHIPVITSPPTRSSISLSFKPVDSPGLARRPGVSPLTRQKKQKKKATENKYAPAKDSCFSLPNPIHPKRRKKSPFSPQFSPSSLIEQKHTVSSKNPWFCTLGFAQHYRRMGIIFLHGRICSQEKGPIYFVLISLRKGSNSVSPKRSTIGGWGSGKKEKLRTWSRRYALKSDRKESALP